MKKTLIKIFIINLFLFTFTIGLNCSVDNPTDDNQSKTNSWYYSIGTFYTRCVYDPAEKQWHPSQQQIYIDHDELDTDGVIDTVIEGHIYSYSATNWDMILSKIYAKGYIEWAHEIEGALNGTGGSCYVRWDHTMRVISKGILVPQYFFNSFPTGIDRHPAEMDSYLISLGWPHHADCLTHFNQYILIGGRAEDIQAEAVLESLGNTKLSHEDTGDAEYKYGHDSVDGYDLTEGIPSGKSLSYTWEKDA